MFVFLPQIMLLNLNNKIGMFQILALFKTICAFFGCQQHILVYSIQKAILKCLCFYLK